MTVVEFFEKAPIENMITTLTSRPEKLIFVGVESLMNKSIKVYEDFLIKKDYPTKVERRAIEKNNLHNILKVLTEIIETEQDCVFDITGGEDTVLLAIGMLFENYKNIKPFKMQRFNIHTNKIIDCDLDDCVSFEGAFPLTVKELVSLYEGIVVPEEPQPPKTADINDINILWELLRNDPVEWNRSLSALHELEKKSAAPKGSLDFVLDRDLLSPFINNFNEKYTLVSTLLKKLYDSGLLCRFSMHNKTVKYTYRDSLIKRYLKKEGNLLELKTYFEARNLTQNGLPFFADCFLSVTIDWDGVIHAQNDKNKDTRNEIDVMLMKGLIPVFISCKNGTIKEDELYKLHTVATQFGGKYAKKVLIAAKLDRDTESANEAYIQRAKDMNITLVPNAIKFEDSDWQDFLRNLVK